MPLGVTAVHTCQNPKKTKRPSLSCFAARQAVLFRGRTSANSAKPRWAAPRTLAQSVAAFKILPPLQLHFTVSPFTLSGRRGAVPPVAALLTRCRVFGSRFSGRLDSQSVSIFLCPYSSAFTHAPQASQEKTRSLPSSAATHAPRVSQEMQPPALSASRLPRPLLFAKAKSSHIAALCASCRQQKTSRQDVGRPTNNKHTA